MLRFDVRPARLWAFDWGPLRRCHRGEPRSQGVSTLLAPALTSFGPLRVVQKQAAPWKPWSGVLSILSPTVTAAPPSARPLAGQVLVVGLKTASSLGRCLTTRLAAPDAVVGPSHRKAPATAPQRPLNIRKVVRPPPSVSESRVHAQGSIASTDAPPRALGAIVGQKTAGPRALAGTTVTGAVARRLTSVTPQRPVRRHAF